MKKRALTALLLLLVLASFGQSYLGQNRQKVGKRLQQYLAQNQYTHSAISSTDSSLVMQIEEPGIARVAFTYLFSGKGKCSTEVIESGCDSCFQKQVAYVLKEAGPNWKMVGNHTYVSTYPKKIMMVLTEKDRQQRASIYRMAWSREEYEELLSR